MTAPGSMRFSDATAGLDAASIASVAKLTGLVWMQRQSGEFETKNYPDG